MNQLQHFHLLVIFLQATADILAIPSLLHLTLISLGEKLCYEPHIGSM